MFNALKYTKQLEEVGLTREQAETHVQIMIEIMELNLATKEDIKELRHDMAQLESRLIIKLGAMLAVMLPLSLSIFGYILTTILKS